jgi:carbamoyl-phosphate synthase / aspartate carbamoyltransferase
MVGYPEALTDPSYRGQILVLTFPLIGNYGVPCHTVSSTSSSSSTDIGSSSSGTINTPTTTTTTSTATKNQGSSSSSTPPPLSLSEDDLIHQLPLYMESYQVQIAGLIVSEYSWHHSHWAAKSSLQAWLQHANIPAIYGIDTRALTKRLREHGSLLGRMEIVTCTLLYYVVVVKNKPFAFYSLTPFVSLNIMYHHIRL